MRKFRISWILIFLVVLLFSGKTYPVLRAMGALSPHIVPGCSFGALIMEETGHVDEAIYFLNEEIENNPYAFELRIYRDFMIRLFKTHEYEKAIKGRNEASQCS